MPDINKNKCRVVTDYVHSWYIWILEKIKKKSCEKCGKKL